MYKTNIGMYQPEPVADACPAARPPDYAHSKCKKVVLCIAERGHRIVHMRPLGSSRNYSQEELRAIVSGCRVEYRGYSHPCMIDGRCGSTFSMDRCIGASHASLGDAWWLWGDGKMLGARALSWDGGLARATWPRHLEPIEALYDMNEVFAFASNLATATATPYLVCISFGNMGGTALHIHTRNWSPLSEVYMSRANGMVLAPAVVEPCAARETYASVALERTLDILGHYGMDREAPRYKLAREQGWFYGRRLHAALGRWRGGLCSGDYP